MIEKKKFLFVSIDARSGDLAWIVLKEGHEVKYYIKDNSEKEVYDGFVPKINDWEKEIDWADVIIFDDAGWGEKAKRLREQGKLVIGGTPYTDRLEDERSFGQEELKALGIPIISHEDFTSFDDAIEYVKKNPGKYVLKPSGEAQSNKGLLYIGMEDDGSDMIQVLGDYKKAWSKNILSFQLQKRISGVEIAVGAFFNGNSFVYPINVNFEHKKLFPGELGPSTGEMGCYDDQTEVLTKKGWKLFKDIKKDDEIITLNKRGFIEYQYPTDIISLDTHKKILLIKNQTLDIAVTLNHNMYGIEANKYRNGKMDFGFVRAKDLPGQFVIPRTAGWNGHYKKSFRIPSVKISHYEGRSIKHKDSDNIILDMNDWIKFLGFYIAEGSCSKGYRISLSCIKNKKDVKKMLSRLPFKLKETKTEFIIYNKQLWNYLVNLGKAPEKYIPEFVKSLSQKQIKYFLDWYGKGDANINNGFRIFYTSSKILADDIQELLLKIGRLGIIKKRTRKGKIWIKDHWTKINHPQYEVLERIKKSVSWIDKRDMEIVDYNKKVYCVTVPNHTLYVRKNGKPYFCGNTAMFWSNSNRLFNKTLKKFESKLAEEKYAGYIDINCIVNGNGIYPLEWTTRFGYPTMSIQQEGIIMPMGEFLFGLAEGTLKEMKVRSGFQIGVMIVVPPFPFTDKETFEVKSKDSVIHFKNGSGGIHICDVRMVNDEWLIAGQQGVALVVCGTGSTMKQAQSMAYNRIKNINIPHMYFRYDIGNRWLEDSDKLHNWGYLRES